MEPSEIENLTALIGICIIDTLSRLDLITENLSQSKAHEIYGKKNIVKWRQLGWIVAYESGNKTYATVYFRRSECEKAMLMTEASDKPRKGTRINQIIDTQIKSHLNYENSKNYKAIPAKL